MDRWRPVLACGIVAWSAYLAYDLRSLRSTEAYKQSPLQGSSSVRIFGREVSKKDEQ
jgi:hypothetical protein